MHSAKDGITLLHAHLFALLSLGTNEFDPIAQRDRTEKLIARLDTETKNFSRFLDGTAAVPPASADHLRASFAAYANRVRETIEFAAYDSSYGALNAGVTDDQFGVLSASLDQLVQLLAQRRLALAEEAVTGSLDAQHLLLGLGTGASMLVLLGSVVVGRSIARPVLGLTTLMNRLAGGDTDLAVPGSEQRDEVGAMARAVELFRANSIARRLGELALRRTNLLFDAALNSMQQGLIVYGPDNLVQLVNRRYFENLRHTPGQYPGRPDGARGGQRLRRSWEFSRAGTERRLRQGHQAADPATLDAGRDGGAPGPVHSHRGGADGQ